MHPSKILTSPLAEQLSHITCDFQITLVSPYKIELHSPNHSRKKDPFLCYNPIKDILMDNISRYTNQGNPFYVPPLKKLVV